MFPAGSRHRDGPRGARRTVVHVLADRLRRSHGYAGRDLVGAGYRPARFRCRDHPAVSVDLRDRSRRDRSASVTVFYAEASTCPQDNEAVGELYAVPLRG
jgi:hypothetical protein